MYFSFLRTSQDIADDLVVFNPPKLPTTQMILFAEFLYATLFLKLSRQTTNNSKKELIFGKGFFPSLLHGSVFFFFFFLPSFYINLKNVKHDVRINVFILRFGFFLYSPMTLESTYSL